MIVNVDELTPLVRYLVVDYARPWLPGDVFTYTSSNVFTLSQPYPTSIIAVYWNGTSTTNYTIDSTGTVLTENDTLNQGDTIQVQYNYYPNYADLELQAYVQSAIIYLSVNNYYTFEIDSFSNIYPDMTQREMNLVAFVASILAKPDNVAIRLPDMNISTPIKSMPTRDIVAQAVRIFKHSSTGVFDVAGFGSAFPTTYYYYFR
jgi:hypothetical protein